MKILRIGALVALAVAGMSAGYGHAFAAGATQHYGPYASGSPDSGTCGNSWATDTFNRDYSVQGNTITEQFKDGTFVTNAGPSPEGCGKDLGGTVAAGVTGTMQGSFTIVVSGGNFNPDATCAAPCYTADFVAAFFGSSASYSVPTYSLHYNAGSNGDWKNADIGTGDQGDITGAP